MKNYSQRQSINKEKVAAFIAAMACCAALYQAGTSEPTPLKVSQPVTTLSFSPALLEAKSAGLRAESAYFYGQRNNPFARVNVRRVKTPALAVTKTLIGPPPATTDAAEVTLVAIDAERDLKSADEFKYQGIVIYGGESHALLHDMDTKRHLRARMGERLRGSDVTVTSIDAGVIRVQAGTEQKRIVSDRFSSPAIPNLDGKAKKL